MEAVRTCVGCRQRASRSALLRVIRHSEELIPDFKAIKPGRGAWLHPVSECLEKAIQRNAFGRSLKCNRAPDATGLIQSIEKAEMMLAFK
jgi:predicted RNA-binding protein YlxR (DUF448 family)